MFVVCDRLNQPQNVFACFRVEAVEQDSVGRPIIAHQLQLRIVHGHVAVVSNAQFGPDLQNNLHPFAIASHLFASQFAFSIIACYPMDAAPGQKDPLLAF
jgi:hypothetical protein